MTPAPYDQTTQRLRAGALLALFVLALVLGVLGHPFSQNEHHACSGELDHLVADHSHDHDEAACAACHLFQSLQQSNAPASSLPIRPSTGEQALLPVDARAAPSRTVLAYQGRGPPAV